MDTPVAWSSDLVCWWLSWEVAGPKRLIVRLPNNGRTEMGGAIRVAQMLMPDVGVIECVAGDQIDTVYLLLDGKWEAAGLLASNRSIDGTVSRSSCRESQNRADGRRDCGGRSRGVALLYYLKGQSWNSRK